MSLLVGTLIAAGCGDADTTAEVRRAARAPYVALFERDAKALCADFTSAAANRLARRMSRSTNCDERVADMFARSAPFELKLQPAALSTVKVGDVTKHGNVASAIVNYGGSGSRVTLELKRVGGTWRVATQPTLGLIRGCYVRGLLTTDCPKNAQVMLFSIGRPKLRSEPSGGVNERQLVPVPSAVENAGGSELSKFNTGMEVVAQSGCLACHRIGDQGNSGPGPDLTQVGSKLSAEQIEHAILDPTAPMPSFKNLPRGKLTAIVEFLSQLQSRKS